MVEGAYTNLRGDVQDLGKFLNALVEELEARMPGMEKAVRIRVRRLDTSDSGSDTNNSGSDLGMGNTGPARSIFSRLLNRKISESRYA